jgi:RimJ/RimL family protein N-acetyltransferase
MCVRLSNKLPQFDNTDVLEVKNFIYSLTEDEKTFYDIQKDKVLESLIYIKGVRVDDKLVGIGGIARWYYIFPHAFYMVKTGYQGQGIGGILVDSNVIFAKNNLKILLNVSDKANIRAVKLVAHRGFKVVGSDKFKNYCYFPLGCCDWFAKLVIKVRTICFKRY